MKTSWTFEPAHTAAGFCVRHMMVTNVCGYFKDIHGKLVYDFKNPKEIFVDVIIDARGVWTGSKERDKHIKGSDFLDVDNHTSIIFQSHDVDQIGASEYKLHGDLTIRGVKRRVDLDIFCLGEWDVPYKKNGIEQGPKKRIGFYAKTMINRHDFGVSWNEVLDRGGVVVGDEVYITIDAEAILDDAKEDEGYIEEERS